MNDDKTFNLEKLVQDAMTLELDIVHNSTKSSSSPSSSIVSSRSSSFQTPPRPPTTAPPLHARRIAPLQNLSSPQSGQKQQPSPVQNNNTSSGSGSYLNQALEYFQQHASEINSLSEEEAEREENQESMQQQLESMEFRLQQEKTERVLDQHKMNQKLQLFMEQVQENQQSGKVADEGYYKQKCTLLRAKCQSLVHRQKEVNQQLQAQLSELSSKHQIETKQLTAEWERKRSAKDQQLLALKHRLARQEKEQETQLRRKEKRIQQLERQVSSYNQSPVEGFSAPSPSKSPRKTQTRRGGWHSELKMINGQLYVASRDNQSHAHPPQSLASFLNHDG